MDGSDTKRLSRLIAILTLLQTKRLMTAPELAARFSVSVRTIYRDIQALVQAGVPVLTEEGRGYSVMEGYRLPPVMFTEEEVNALVTAEKLIHKNQDPSFRQAFADAASKIKAVLRYEDKDRVALLSSRMAVSPVMDAKHSGPYFICIQQALTSFTLLEITYNSRYKEERTVRRVEPFALYFSLEERWLLIAYCRLRQDYRMFHLDNMESVRLLDEHFMPHTMTLDAYLKEKREKFRTSDTGLS